jgi:hypothetical protein
MDTGTGCRHRQRRVCLRQETTRPDTSKSIPEPSQRRGYAVHHTKHRLGPQSHNQPKLWTSLTPRGVKEIFNMPATPHTRRSPSNCLLEPPKTRVFSLPLKTNPLTPPSASSRGGGLKKSSTCQLYYTQDVETLTVLRDTSQTDSVFNPPSKHRKHPGVKQG